MDGYGGLIRAHKLRTDRHKRVELPLFLADSLRTTVCAAR